jgi:hypothetical protein
MPRAEWKQLPSGAWGATVAEYFRLTAWDNTWAVHHVSECQDGHTDLTALCGAGVDTRGDVAEMMVTAELALAQWFRSQATALSP